MVKVVFVEHRAKFPNLYRNLHSRIPINYVDLQLII